jgi:phosphoribosylformylglycinamidine (FGAM) synthase PurS component
MYLNYKEIKEKEAEEIKEILLKKYPNSIYVEMVNNPNSSLERATKKDLEELAYEDVFNLYQKKMFDFVIEETQDILDDKYKNKKLFLRALSFIQINEIDLAIENIKKISEEEDKLLKEARYILESIEDPSKMEKANELAVLGSPYMYRKNQDHMIVLVLPKNGVDVTYLKTLISEFHTNQIGNEAFDISALLLGLDKHLLMIKSFQNANESMDYYQLFEGEKSVMDFLNKTEYNLMSISVENFPEFYKYKDVDGYSRFFIKNYTTSNY